MVPLATITNSAGNTWTKAASVTQGARSDGEIWFSTGALSVVSVSVHVGTSASLSMTVLDLTGASSSPLDRTATAAGDGKTAGTGTTGTTSQASEIAVAVVGWNGTPTVGQQSSGFTQTSTFQSTAQSNASGEQAAYSVLTASAAQSYAARFSTSQSWTGLIATFRMGSPPPPPLIGGFSPTGGIDGTTVVITGTYFTGATAVAFNGVLQTTLTVDSDTQITTTVPSGATTGPISIVTGGGTATSTAAFTVDPVITGLSPTSGAECSAVNVAGSGFSGVTSAAFNGTVAPVLSSSDAQIATLVPVGASSGPVSVTTPSGTAASSVAFTVLNPAAATAGVSPTSGAEGSTVVITGTGFTGTTALSFNCTNQPVFTVDSDTQITTTVPAVCDKRRHSHHDADRPHRVPPPHSRFLRASRDSSRSAVLWERWSPYTVRGSAMRCR